MMVTFRGGGIPLGRSFARSLVCLAAGARSRRWRICSLLGQAAGGDVLTARRQSSGPLFLAIGFTAACLRGQASHASLPAARPLACPRCLSIGPYSNGDGEMGRDGWMVHGCAWRIWQGTIWWHGIIGPRGRIAKWPMGQIMAWQSETGAGSGCLLRIEFCILTSFVRAAVGSAKSHIPQRRARRQWEGGRQKTPRQADERVSASAAVPLPCTLRWT